MSLSLGHLQKDATTPGRKGNLTGSARKVKDNAADWHNLILKWERLSDEGSTNATKIVNFRLSKELTFCLNWKKIVSSEKGICELETFPVWREWKTNATVSYLVHKAFWSPSCCQISSEPTRHGLHKTSVGVLCGTKMLAADSLILDQLTDLAELLFTQPPQFYYDPAALASTLRPLLRQRVQKMMDILEKL
ncbi:hypothetical protein QTP70_021854 [Hemibagrus guttatus]|uniref:Uncharacterized protein n=1 Tax=Hemibagrus guttatus TaxID=175788 RepID=A0AAE0PQ27_9TELE|nr:hypothetical protein QTP70_021854 [Hemibagrus guttatus]